MSYSTQILGKICFQSAISAVCAVGANALLQGRKVIWLGELVKAGTSWQVAAFAGGGIFAVLALTMWFITNYIQVRPLFDPSDRPTRWQICGGAVAYAAISILATTPPLTVITFVAIGAIPQIFFYG